MGSGGKVIAYQGTTNESMSHYTYYTTKVTRAKSCFDARASGEYNEVGYELQYFNPKLPT